MSGSSPPVVLRLDKVSKHFGRIAAVSELSFEVFEGDIFGFLGPNGAGKSTTFYMIAGLVAPSGGRIEIFGRPPHDLEGARAKMGALLETPAFYEYLSGRQNLEVLARLQPGISRSRVDEVLDLVGLTDRARDHVSDYSHGMKQRLGIAQALLNSPRLILLDEPTSGLDPEGSRQVWALLRRLARDERVTIVISSHLLHEVEEGCNRIAVINEGILVACDEVRSLLFFSREDYLVVFDNDDALGRARALLSGMAGVEFLSVDADDSLGPLAPADGSGLWVRVQSGLAPEVITRLAQAGLAPREFVRQRKTLKQFFFDLTRRRPAAAGDARR